MRLIVYTVLWICVATGFNAYAQKPQKFIVDSTNVTVRHFNRASLTEYRLQKEFRYDAQAVDAGLSWWERFWLRIWQMINSISIGQGTGSALKYILLIIGVSAIVFLAIKFFGLDLKLFIGKPEDIPVPYEESLENIHEISFADEIEKAVQLHNYRLAVRLLYLHALKKLHDSGVIRWQSDKTNSAYVNEIKNPAKREQFSLLTRRFEYIWYGDFPVDQATFGQIHSAFQQFNQSRA
ncbi:DUF4129 domain-containing protein (plasmid) [Pedobacter sp. BS3]|uniref:DUF4129 domain-containing protein n=1 Tax=Pedobacter sp. BS3 TaxID=2567937 RepID=UPI0011F03FEE|nr:DUF4129 domain-containing protein [Pedobacter sp. BS3]TZF85664.1 DUF4129 domain-containing protein [Pedobacter sp. BS3]